MAAEPPGAPSRRSILWIGIGVALLTLVLDQATKFYIDVGSFVWPTQAIEVTSFLDFVVVWNRGVSYGLFPQGETGRWVLVALKVAASVLFAVWLAKSRRRLEALALGLLIGGAIGNAVDRVVRGAVLDFISLHAFGYRWYVFNIADVAVVVGVALLLYDAFSASASKTPPSASPMVGEPDDKREA